MPTFRCKKCKFLYIDEQQEKPLEEQDDARFKCPRCRASKRMFEKLSIS